MGRARAERWLSKLWQGSDLALAPYERPTMPPPEPEPSAPPPAKRPMTERLDELLNIRVATPAAAAARPPKKKRTLLLLGQDAAHTKGVAVVEHLYRLGRNDLGKRRKPGSLNPARLNVCAARDGFDQKEIESIRRSQAFSDPRNRPGIIMQSIAQWRKAR
jgi:hypothetical protein